MFSKSLFAVVAVFALMAVSFPVPVLAADKVAEEEKQKEPEGNPYLAEFEKRSRQIAKELNGEELKHLYHVRETFGAVKAVKIVRRDVSAAVDACGEANPDLKKPMNKRFSAWAAAVDPVVKEKEAEIEKAISTQTYAKPKEIHDYLGLIEKTTDHANQQIDKNIVTTKEACTSLMKSMDKTEKVVTSLVADMKLVPWPPVPAPDPAGKIESTPH